MARLAAAVCASAAGWLECRDGALVEGVAAADDAARLRATERDEDGGEDDEGRRETRGLANDMIDADARKPWQEAALPRSWRK